MKIIAVTSCPIGMAHTYMASAALKKAGEKLGVEMRVETQGSMGIRDRLSSKEIKNADLLILAADVTPLEPERFRNKKTFKVTTSKIIRNANKVVQEALDSLSEEN